MKELLNKLTNVSDNITGIKILLRDIIIRCEGIDVSTAIIALRVYPKYKQKYSQVLLPIELYNRDILIRSSSLDGKMNLFQYLLSGTIYMIENEILRKHEEEKIYPEVNIEVVRKEIENYRLIIKDLKNEYRALENSINTLSEYISTIPKEKYARGFQAFLEDVINTIEDINSKKVAILKRLENIDSILDEARLVIEGYYEEMTEEVLETGKEVEEV